MIDGNTLGYTATSTLILAIYTVFQKMFTILVFTITKSDVDQF